MKPGRCFLNKQFTIYSLSEKSNISLKDHDFLSKLLLFELSFHFCTVALDWGEIYEKREREKETLLCHSSPYVNMAGWLAAGRIRISRCFWRSSTREQLIFSISKDTLTWQVDQILSIKNNMKVDATALLPKASGL